VGVRRSRRRPRRRAFDVVSIVFSIVVSIVVSIDVSIAVAIVLPEIVVGTFESFAVTADVREQLESPSPDLARRREIRPIDCRDAFFIL